MNIFYFHETSIKIDKLNSKIEGGGFWKKKRKKKEGGGFQGVGFNSLTNRNRVRSKSCKPCDMMVGFGPLLLLLSVSLVDLNFFFLQKDKKINKNLNDDIWQKTHIEKN